MSGRRIMVAFLIVVALFAAALIYFQFFAFYERTGAPEAVAVETTELPVRDWQGIDATSSPLKRRACFRTDPDALSGVEPTTGATPLNAPFWFDCFDAGQLTDDLESGRAAAYAVARDEPAGFDIMVAVYPDGSAYLWRQLNERFR